MLYTWIYLILLLFGVVTFVFTELLFVLGMFLANIVMLQGLNGEEVEKDFTGGSTIPESVHFALTPYEKLNHRAQNRLFSSTENPEMQVDSFLSDELFRMHLNDSERSTNETQYLANQMFFDRNGDFNV